MIKTKTKVLFLISSLKFRGAEKMLINLVNGLDQNEFSVTVVSLSNDNPMASQIRLAAAVRFLMLPRRWRYDMRPALQIRKIILSDRIDTVVGFDIFSFFYIWFALRNVRCKPKIFISIHNFKYGNYKRLVQNLIYARLLSGREVFLAVCNAQADYWSKMYRIPRRNFLTIYNGVDTDLFLPTDTGLKNLIRSRFGVPENAFVILQVASLSPEKRHEDSLTALKHLVDIAPSNSICLVFVGSGSQERERRLVQMTHDLNLVERVFFLGAHDDVKPFYEIADMFTLTSSTETFSVAALEAMSMGLPCVITDVGGAREMIVDGLNGCLAQTQNPCSIAEGWLTVYENRDHFDSKRIRDHVVRNFSLNECVGKYENLLK